MPVPDHSKITLRSPIYLLPFMQTLNLPSPDAAAQSACASLVALIAAEIQAQAGWISFERYMDLALYAPQLGYYTGGATKLGSAGDFITAPEISDLFGATLASFALQILPQTANELMEFGAGTGKLAADLLAEMHHQGRPPARYYIVELSGELRARQQQRLKAYPEVIWLDQMPASFSGLVLGNEVLDALPVRLVKKTLNGWNEVGVGWEHDHLVWREQQLDATAAESLTAQIPARDELPIGYLTEVHPVACGLMSSVAQMVTSADAGAVLWIDYGFPAAEYYLHQRDQGTLMCHYRHHAHAEPFYWPGLQDITAHVDFSAIAQVGVDAGLELLCYTSQASFLIHNELPALLQRCPADDVLRYLPQSQAVQKLVSPAEMGELFKVLIMGHQITLTPELRRNNRAHRLQLNINERQKS